MFPALSALLVVIPAVRAADSWDDFSSNLATDLAPFLSLFGEQITKQYLSESITLLDYFIFAMVPMGILTAVVSVIRVCGSPSLRAFIGRAQEGAGNAEAELCSSTSRDVCELYNNGGIARVFGRPKILEVVHDPAKQNFADGTAGLYTFREYVNRKDQDEWQGQSLHEVDESGRDMGLFAPNLSLNVGIKRQPPAVFWAVAILGLLLQSTVLAFAVVVTYFLRWEKDKSQPASYACPLTILGTILVCGGIFLCAFLVGQSTEEQRFYRNRGTKAGQAAGTKNRTQSCIYWVQPGRQVLGDQVFDAFCCSDSKNPLQEYIASWKKRSQSWSKNAELAVWAAVAITVTGFILQFIGLRGIHSAVSMFQLGAIMIMSAFRAALRMQRLKPEDNYFRSCPDEIVGHELDWLALRIGREGVQKDESSVSSPTSRSTSSAGYSTPTTDSHYFWKYTGLPKAGSRITLDPPNVSVLPCAAGRLLAYRSRLAQLTQSSPTQTKAVTSATSLEPGMVTVRQEAQRLRLAVESVINKIYSTTGLIRQEERTATRLGWQVNVAVPDKLSELQSINLLFVRDDSDVLWKMQDKFAMEGLLGLWLWSLKSDPVVEIEDRQNNFTMSRAVEIPARRIVATDINLQADLRLWLGGDAGNFTEGMMNLSCPNCDNPSTIWQDSGELYLPFAGKKLPEQLDSRISRFFGWQAMAMGVPHMASSNTYRIWTATTNNPLLSLCSQEILASFIASILVLVDDVGGIDIQDSETRHLRLKNTLVSELTGVFTETQIGSKEDALLCILPSILHKLSISSTEGALLAARKAADDHRKRHEWKKAEDLLRWVWRNCIQSHVRVNSDAAQFTPRAATALGELYRWALCGNETKEFGFAGFKWLRQQKRDNDGILSEATETVIDRYTEIAEQFGQQRKNPTGVGLHMALREGEIATLLHLTQSSSLTMEAKGQALCKASEQGWPEVVLALLELGAEPDFKNEAEGSRTALSFAAQNGNLEVVKELIGWQSFPNSADAAHRTPLSYASEGGHSHTVKMLLADQRVDPDAKDTDGNTALSFASKYGHDEVVLLLVRTGRVNPYVENASGKSALQLALEKNDLPIVQLLLKTDTTNENSTNKSPDAALRWAAENGHEGIVRLLLQKTTLSVNFDTTDKHGWTPLLLAVRSGNITIIELLLDAGASPDVRTEAEETILHLAARNGDGTLFEILLRTKGVELKNARDGQERTPLWVAAQGGHVKIVELLLGTGAENDARNRFKQTPLRMAAQHGHCAVVKMLLESNCEPDARDCNERTPLWTAAKNGHEQIVELLLQTHKVDPDAIDIAGHTPLWAAAENGHKTIMSLLSETGKVELDYSKRRLRTAKRA